jgi:hypothetical protein
LVKRSFSFTSKAQAVEKDVDVGCLLQGLRNKGGQEVTFSLKMLPMTCPGIPVKSICVVCLVGGKASPPLLRHVSGEDGVGLSLSSGKLPSSSSSLPALPLLEDAGEAGAAAYREVLVALPLMAPNTVKEGKEGKK